MDKIHRWALSHQESTNEHLGEEFRIKPMRNTFQAWRPMVRVIAWIKRFINGCRHKKARNRFIDKKPNYDKIPRIDPSEFMQAEMIYFRYAQRQDFQEELSVLGRCGTLRAEYRNLDLYLDQETQLIKVNSRLRLSNYVTTYGNPILLPKDHYVTKEFVLANHKLTGHAAIGTVLNNTRRRAWVVGGRRTIKKILHGCRCRNTIPMEQKMA